MDLSDFDIALASPELLVRVSQLISDRNLRGAGTRTGPLGRRVIEELGLTALQESLSLQAGRPVNFFIFDSIDTAVGRSPSIPVNR